MLEGRREIFCLLSAADQHEKGAVRWQSILT
jgi:hypothetical protein